jgi:hypothetical protein
MKPTCPHCHKRLPSSPSGTPADTCPACGKPLPAPAPEEAAQPEGNRRLGGYEVLKTLGQGGMGSVYLARQVSLDREVALKVMHPKVASNPTFLARFLREALAAAKLVHPHVVQIYDVGEDHGVRYYSMELVRGTSLGQMLKKKGRLEVVPVARYILQAARGLLFAHNRGIIHRDIKPDNLLLDQLGIIKIADLGLVKMPVDPATAGGPGSVNLTAPGMTVGTAAYMAPEQARACVDVDRRADIYSLGCTFYALLAGRPPFIGGSSLEIMTRHCTDPLPPLEDRVPGLPPAISAIVNRMLAKAPEDRYPDCKPLIADLKQFLDRVSGKDSLPSVQHVARLQSCVRRFQAPAARLRDRLLLVSLATVAVAVLATVVFRRPMWAVAALFLAFAAGLSRLLLHGVVYRTPVFLKLRELVLESSRGDWLFWGIAVLVVLVLLLTTSMGAVMAALIVLAVGWAVTLHFLLDRRAAAQRRPVVADASRLLEELRKEGMDEEALQYFVFDHGGDAWEEFFEAVFGYDWMLRARQEWANVETAARRPRHAIWRDPLIRALESLRQIRQRARERKMLANVAAAAAEGSPPVVATGPWAPLPDASQAAVTPTPVGPTVDYRPMHAQAPPPRTGRSHILMPLPERPRSSLSEMAEQFVEAVFGPRVRGLVGLLLITGCVLWIHQNNLISEEDLADPTRLASLDMSRAEPLRLAFLPAAILKPFHSLNPGIAGLVLLLSLFWQSWRINLFLIPAAAVIFLGDSLGLPALAIGSGGFALSLHALIIGGILLALGFVFHFLFEPRDLSRHEI